MKAEQFIASLDSERREEFRSENAVMEDCVPPDYERKGCIRFRKAVDLELNVIGEVLASIPMERWIAVAKEWRRR